MAIQTLKITQLPLIIIKTTDKTKEHLTGLLCGARHPGLKAGTVDLRCQGSAVKAEANNPAAIHQQHCR